MAEWVSKLRTIALTSVVGLLVGGMPVMGQEIPVMKAAISTYIVPNYQQVVTAAHQEAQALEALCKTPSEVHLDAARVAFSGLVKAWSRVDFIRFGPVLSDNRLESILFWPDRKSTGLKQVQRVLASQDQSVLTLADLQGKSVAMRGLGALEFVLFGTDAEALKADAGAFRCSYGKVIAQAIEAQAGQIVADWQQKNGIAQRLMTPQADYADYRDRSEVLSELIGLWIHGTELMRDTRISPFLGDTLGDARAKSALFWRSNLTIPALKWSAEGMGDLLALSGLNETIAADQHWALDAYVFEVENFKRVADELDGSLDALLATPEGWGKVNYLRIITQSWQNLMAEHIAASLGIGVGFSSLDGD